MFIMYKYLKRVKEGNFIILHYYITMTARLSVLPFLYSFFIELWYTISMGYWNTLLSKVDTQLFLLFYVTLPFFPFKIFVWNGYTTWCTYYYRQRPPYTRQVRKIFLHKESQYSCYNTKETEFNIILCVTYCHFPTVSLLLSWNKIQTNKFNASFEMCLLKLVQYFQHNDSSQNFKSLIEGSN